MKLLRKRDYLLLSLAIAGDIVEGVVGRGNAAWHYGNMSLLVGGGYKRTNFTALAGRLLRTGQIERIVDKKGNVVFRLSPGANEYVVREFNLERLRHKWNKRWTVVIFDIPEDERWVRDKLRMDLESLGFGMLQRSVWISPFPIAEDIREYLVLNGLAGNALVMVGPWLLAGNQRDLARRVFKLDKVNERYENIIFKWQTSSKGKRAKKRFAFKFLQILAKDPLLPYQLLPDDWAGEQARVLFKRIIQNR